MVLKTILGVILKDKKAKVAGALKEFIKKKKGGVEAITGIVPNISKKFKETFKK